MNAPGRVILIGAGPGAPGLLTVAALDALREADIVLFDRLAGSAFRRFVRPTTELVDVGKQPGRSQPVQDEISRRLVEEARAGRVVARVKGGNPFVFGRGFEEVRHCVESGVPVHVVPGVSSAIAAPTAAGVPLTHRGLAPLFTVVSGHEDPAKSRHPVDWEMLGRLEGAIVVLMGVGTVGAYSARLIAGGRSPDTPVAAISHATTDRQAVVRATLGDAAEVFSREAVESPAVIVVGEHVALMDDMVPALGDLLAPEVMRRGSSARRLSGWRIAVPRSLERQSSLSLLLRAEGALAFDVPVLSFGPPEERDPTQALVGALRGQAVPSVVLTSTVAVDMLVRTLVEAGDDIRLLAGVEVVARSSEVAAHLRRHGIVADSVEPNRVQSAHPGSGTAIVVRLAGEDDGYVESLRQSVAAVEVVDVGRGVPPVPVPSPEDGRLAGLDAVTFSSSRTVRAWVDLRLPIPPVVACIGARTAAAASEAGIEPDVVPREPGLPQLVESLAVFAAGRGSPA